MVRQLTAIMFTDMAGYTALMQRDEHEAKVKRDRQREVLVRCIEASGGRILQFYGDGTLSVFQSAVAAVQSAVGIQEELTNEADPVALRIGIHSGDVVHDENGVFGDGVNVASRIEGLGIPGSVLISGKVYDEVKNQPDIRTHALGSFNLKNIKHPMKVYAIANKGLTIPSESSLRFGRVARTRSIAVLPFVNMSSDPENEFFSDGMTEEIINALTRVNGLQVTARTSSFAFKNTKEDIRGIAERLAVTHVLEGSVRKAGSQVRVTAQLICAQDGYHLMSEVYDGSLDDIFALQDEIALRIVERLVGHLGPVPTSAGGDGGLVHAHSHDSEAYAEYLRGRFAWARWSPDGAREAIRHYDRSIEMDPHCALPFSGLAAAYVFLGATGQSVPAEAFAKAGAAASQAVAIEGTAGEAHSAQGVVRLFRDWDWDGAYRSFQKALSLTPGSAEAHQLYAMYLRALGDMDAAVDEYQAALQLDPLSIPIRLNLAEALIASCELDAAEAELVAILKESPSFRAATEELGWIRMLSGEPEKALELFDKLPGLANLWYAGAAPRGFALAKLGRREEALAMLEVLERRAQQFPDTMLAIDFAIIHQGLGDLDRTFEYLNEAADQKAGTMVFLQANPRWSHALRSDDRFDALLRRVGHPKLVAPVPATLAPAAR